MDGYRFFTSFFSPLLALVILLQSPTSFAKDDRCSWSCGKIPAASQNEKLKGQFDQVRSFLDGKTSCALVEGFDGSERNVRLGAFQALAISTQNCSLPTDLNITTKQFLYQVMSLQGLKLSPESKTLKAKEVEPSQLFKNAKDYSCINVISESEGVHTGDILVSKGDALVIDTVGVDPFGIDAKVRENARRLDQESKFEGGPEISAIFQKSKKLCEEWVKDPAQFKISVFHAHGRSALFPAFGRSSSPWVTAISERATNACVSRVSEEIAKRSGATFPVKNPSSAASASGVLVLRHNSAASACRVGRDLMPKARDLECVQCCDFSAREDK